MNFNLLYREQLLNSIVEIAKEIEGEKRLPLSCVEVQFRNKDGESLHETSFVAALDGIINDVYWDENGDWREASALTWRTL